MDIEIESKKNNPLMNRTEVYFTVKHPGEKTPNREIIRSELADKLNAKKENIIVNSINSSFGTSETTGYAKVYSSIQKAKDVERNHILKRNKIGVEEKKKEEKPTEEASSPAEPPKEEASKEKPEDKPEEKTEDKPEQADENQNPVEPVADEPPKEEIQPSVEEVQDEKSEESEKNESEKKE